MSDTQLPAYPASRRRASKEADSAYAHTGPQQLAKQPARPKGRTPSNAEWLKLRGHLEARLAMLRSWRFTWAQHWTLLEAYLLPRRGIFINETQPTPNTMVRGGVINQNIIDPTGTQAMRICAAGLMSGLMSPGRPWFKLKPAMFSRDDLGEDIANWFDEVESRMYQVMGRSNFYDSGSQMFEDLSTFGTGPMLIYEDDRDVIRCYLNCPGEYFLAVGPDQRINGLYRMFVWTTTQIVEFFGLEACPRDVQELWRTKGSGLDMEHIVACALEPNFPVATPGSGEAGVLPGGFTWREVYWVWGKSTDWPLAMTGFIDPPHVCPRWAVTSNDPYGRSVGMDVLQDVMQLQEMTRQEAEGILKLLRPPMMADMSMKNEPNSTIPGGIMFVAGLSADKGMRPIYQVNPDIKATTESKIEIQKRIKTGFFNDLFLMIAEAGKDMTAYEVAQRQQEKLQVLGPVTERWQNEFASPAIKRIFRIMERKGLLPPLPKDLIGIPLGIEYISPLAMAQKAASTTSMERYAQVVGNMAAVYPEAKPMLKPVEFLREYGQLIGVKSSVMGSDKDVAAFMQQMQQQAAQAQAQQQSAVAVQGAQQLSQTDVGGGVNALQLLAGRGGAGGGLAGATPAGRA